MSGKRDQWGSSLGFVLAASGSAIGLGNLWKFPYITWENKGGIFVIVYLLCVVLIGLPIMISEILLGRRTQKSPVPAFEQLGKKVLGGKNWQYVGWIGVVAGLVILSFYSVIAGWSISAFANCIKWSFSHYETPADGAFGAFVSNGWLQVGLAFLFSLVTAIVVGRGISGGIEKTTKILMPVLLSIMLLLLVNAFTMDGFGNAVGFLFNFNLENFRWHGVLEALGHAFFTLSLGMGAMITYGSYMSKKESILKSSFAIVGLDTLISIFSCLIMYSIIFTFPEIQAKMGASTVGMLFITLPELFYTKMSAGPLLGPIFYLLVAFAALTSTISLLEVVVSLLVDKLGWTRLKSTAVAASSIFALSVLCALSNGAVDFLSNFKPFGNAEQGLPHALNEIFFKNKAGILNNFDHLSANWLLPIGGFFITIFTGWFLTKKEALEELKMVDATGRPTLLFNIYRFLIRFIAPAAILYIIIMVITGQQDFS